ncbi:hypothetical protein BSL78_06044 [Apostichopus japonicus]|uniref:Uncharacterized protein n=1 Tax=Stichopus japonicus TaxID=307972 RepID=A0A2G8L9V8_STIJA|nr:hypothetical protein BSL78_06044 [Apostichopus japonicus]
MYRLRARYICSCQISPQIVTTERDVPLVSKVALRDSTKVNTYKENKKKQTKRGGRCKWDVNDASPKFQTITAEQATLYCMNGTVEGCDRTTFDSGDVKILNDPEEFNGDILIQTYVMGLSKEALKNVLEERRDVYAEGLVDNNNDETSYAITLMFVDDTRVAPPIDHSVDYIMIGVSILILLAACFLALVLKCKESMAEKQKLERYEGNRGSARTQKKTEEVNLTTIKAPDEDSKDASEEVLKH